ncbi:probable protein s-acyltransferase 17, partial [Phtheirospermum japonicum]
MASGVVHGLVTLLVIVSFLCGQWPIFQATFIQRIHFFIYLRAPTTISGDLYILLAGLRARMRFSPLSTIVAIDPTQLYRYMSFLVVGFGILLFLLTSFSDPGVINSTNVSQYLSAYPYDNIIFSAKECSTCKIPKHFLICIYGIVALALILAGRLKELQVIHVLTDYYGI